MREGRRRLEFGDPLAGLGLIRLRLGQERQALEAFEKALAINPPLSGVRRKAEGLKTKLGGGKS